MVLGRLVLNLVLALGGGLVTLVDALVARAVPHVDGCWIYDLGGHPRHGGAAGVCFYIEITAIFAELGTIRLDRGLQVFVLLLVLIVGVVGRAAHRPLVRVLVDGTFDGFEEVLVLLSAMGCELPWVHRL